jgi:RHS repeat-associated protein
MTDVLDSKENKSGTNVISSYDDTVNSLGQRTGVEQAGTAFASARAIQWGYDSLGQVTSADHANTAQSRYYAYDAIGNRNESRKGTATDSGGIITTYATNLLNQYTGINTTAGNPNINPVHDLDGNQTTGPLAVNHAKSVEYIWDAENRLIQAKVNGSVVGTYRYDSQGRRIYKSGSGGVRYFIYDDWNLIGEYNNGSLIRSHIWGTDLSGSSQGAGGVGGLLVSRIGGADYYPLYDGNGNVTEYRNASSTVAHFEYDAFGAVSSFTGPMWDFNLRFSTKYEDFETGLNYYGYRYYGPQLGRWPSRDPIEEGGGLNLYGFVGNNGLNRIDLLGLDDPRDMEPCEQDKWCLEMCENHPNPSGCALDCMGKLTDGEVPNGLGGALSGPTILPVPGPPSSIWSAVGDGIAGAIQWLSGFL